MGQGFITRSGGDVISSVKRGSLTAPASDTPGGFGYYDIITDPALMNIRNAIIYTNADGFTTVTDDTNGVHTIVINGGQVISTTYAASNGKNVGFIHRDGDSHYDPNTGTISGVGTFFVNNRTDKIPVYDYIIFD